MSSKHCRECNLDRDKKYFYNDKSRADGLNPLCKSCASINGKKRRAAYPEKGRTAHYRIKYGITLDKYNDMLIEQDNVCKICKCPETASDSRYGKTRELAIDHDHETGRVRGLLCMSCNTGISRFKDNIDLLTSAIKYLEFNVSEGNNI